MNINQSTELYLCSENVKNVNSESALNDSLLTILTSTIDFLKNELEEKNLFIRTLLYNLYHFSDERHVENKNESFIHVETSSTCSSNSNSMDCESQMSEMLMTSHSTIDDTTNDVNVSNGNVNDIHIQL